MVKFVKAGSWGIPIFLDGIERLSTRICNSYIYCSQPPVGGGGALGYFLGGYVPPGTPNWHPILKNISPKIDTPF